MGQTKSKFINKKRGFTLIELLVVIAIIGILATIVVVNVNSARAKARDVKRISDLQQIQTALEMYYAGKGQYPFSDVEVNQEWDCSVGSGGCNTSCVSYSLFANFLQDLVDEETLSKVPKDPINNGNSLYLYDNWSLFDPDDPICVNNSQHYILYAILERPQPVGGAPNCYPGVLPPVCAYIIFGGQ